MHRYQSLLRKLIDLCSGDCNAFDYAKKRWSYHFGNNLSVSPAILRTVVNLPDEFHATIDVSELWGVIQWLKVRPPMPSQIMGTWDSIIIQKVDPTYGGISSDLLDKALALEEKLQCRLKAAS